MGKYCMNCGNELGDDARFCGKCGAPAHIAPPPQPPQPVYTPMPVVLKKKQGINMLCVVLTYPVSYLSLNPPSNSNRDTAFNQRNSSSALSVSLDYPKNTFETKLYANCLPSLEQAYSRSSHLRSCGI
jgi:hypothetical protein